MTLPMAGSQVLPFRSPSLPSRLFARIRLPFRIKASLEAAGSSSHSANIPEQVYPPIPDFDYPFPTDPAELCNHLHELAGQLRSLLSGCEWLEEGAIEFASDHLADAGEVANIFIGMRGDRKVVVKCYRFYPYTDYLPSYTVRILRDLFACPAYRSLSVEIPQRGIGLWSVQESVLRAVHRCLLYPTASDVPRLRAHGPFKHQRVFTEKLACRKTRACMLLFFPSRIRRSFYERLVPSFWRSHVAWNICTTWI